MQAKPTGRTVPMTATAEWRARAILMIAGKPNTPEELQEMTDAIAHAIRCADVCERLHRERPSYVHNYTEPIAELFSAPHAAPEAGT